MRYFNVEFDIIAVLSSSLQRKKGLIRNVYTHTYIYLRENKLKCICN